MDTLEEVQNQIKVLNNEIKETLVDIREYLLTYAQNPFAGDARQQGALSPSPRAAMPAPVTPPPASPEMRIGVESLPATAPPASGPPAAFASPPPALQPAQTPSAGQGQAAPSVLGEAVLHELLSSRASRKEDGPASESEDKRGSRAAQRSEEDFAGKSKTQSRSAQRGPAPSASPGRNSVRRDYSGLTARRLDQDTSDETDPAFVDEGEPETPAQEQGPVDMVTLAMLAPWVEDGIQRIGRHRLKGVVKTYAATGNLSEEHKDVIFQLINLDSNEAAPAVVSLKDSLAVLAELDNLMVRSRLDKTGTAMLAVYLKRSGAAPP